MKRHKFSSFLAIGGIASAALMQVDLINYNLLVPELMVGIGALGLGKLVYERNRLPLASSQSYSKGHLWL